jgi:hypothetical protein
VADAVDFDRRGRQIEERVMRVMVIVKASRDSEAWQLHAVGRRAACERAGILAGIREGVRSFAPDS